MEKEKGREKSQVIMSEILDLETMMIENFVTK